MKRGREEANCLMLISKVGESYKKGNSFKCKTCNKQFHSFQALGGHRASHKKVKLMACDLSCQLPMSSSTLKPKMHQCPICGVEFAIGQALGGHMRKHRNNALHDANLPIHEKIVLPKSNGIVERFRLCLDLNLTPYENDLNLKLRTPALNLFI